MSIGSLFLPGFLLAFLFLAASGCTKPDPAVVEQHRREIATFRAAKDRQLASPLHSPLTRAQIRTFQGLDYFPVDFSYAVEARFEKLAEPVRFRIGTSSGEEREYLKTGRLEFTLAGRRLALMTYQEAMAPAGAQREDRLFVPFTDGTTGRESYGGGRYLDLPMPAGTSLRLDFNLAYNPYCAYNHNFSCPLPPRENHLPIEVLAGEKVLPSN